MKNNLSSEIEQNPHEILPVWIVEDDQKTGSIIERSLHNNGYECQLFHSGEEFLNFLKDNNPDANSAIMLLDFLLEDTDAISLIRNIHLLGYSNPFVIMTAFGDEKTAVELMKLGAMDYVIKEKLFINQIQKIVIQVSEKVSIRKKLEYSQEELKRNAEKLKNLNQQIIQQKLALENEKSKTDKLLQSILPKKIADELLQQGYTKPRQYKYVSILFADVIGFSDLTKQSHPIDLVSRLDNYFYAFDEIIEYYGLEKIKTIGDCYMCAGGIPEENPQNAITTVIAGLKIQETALRLKKELDPSLPAFRLRLGIHTGEVVAGVVGKNKFAYDIWGDAVNIASRIVEAGEKDKVNISEKTFNLVKDHFLFTERGEVMTKRSLPIKMYFVDQLRPEFCNHENWKTPSNSFINQLKTKQNLKFH